MAKSKKTLDENNIDQDNLVSMLLKKLNENTDGTGCSAYLLDETDNPSYIKDWISTGSHLLDLAISNRPHGGLPVGRIVEFSGEE